MPTIFEARKKLDEFKLLPKGWDFGQGLPVTQYIAALANGVLDAGSDFGIEEADVFPGAQGDVEVHLYHGSHYFEFIIDEDQVMFTYEDTDVKKLQIARVPFRKALEEFERIATGVCRYLELSINYDLRQGRGGLLLTRFATTVTHQDYQLLILPAQFAPATASVTI